MKRAPWIGELTLKDTETLPDTSASYDMDIEPDDISFADTVTMCQCRTDGAG